MKPDCHKCKWRRSVPGDAHISCKHPSLKKLYDSPELQLYAMFASVGRVSPISLINNNELNIKANQHGIDKGWFNFPFNFDTVWLISCDGYEEKND